MRGWAGQELLRSYEAERRPVAIRNVTEASSNLGRMLSTRQRRPPPEIFQPGAAGDAARKEYGAWFTETMKQEWFTLGFHLGYRYDGSPIIWPDGTPAPPLEIVDLYPDRAPGRPRAARLAAGRPLDARPVRPRVHAAAVGPRMRRDGERMRAAAAQAPACRCTSSISSNRTIAELYQRRLVLVRPDGHVAWRADAEPEDARAVIDVVRGARSYASVR